MHSELVPRLKAPRDDAAVLAFPPLAEAAALRLANVQILQSNRLTLQGRPLVELRTLARGEAIAAARQYHEKTGEPIPDFKSDSILLAGHQPELFHPGVWFKNFALHGLARQQGATPLNLVVDNDTAKNTVLRVPHETRIERIPFDAWHSEIPYEERPVQDEGLFASLPDRVAPLTNRWPFQPLLADFWSAARQQRKRTPLLGERLAAARRSFERAWGSQPFELPLSRLCQTEAFAWFAVHVLRELPRFHAAYNAAVHNYRQRHGIRSSLHPVPDLAQDGPWLETPFWAWRTGDQRRQRLHALVEPNRLQMRAGTTIWPELGGDAPRQAAQWQGLESTGYKVRTRALTTTLFSRLLIGDLFLHGIGGGKYDEVTDALFREFFELPPPGYLTLTATCLLPLPRYPDAAGAQERLRLRERDVRWNPQRCLVTAQPEALALVDQKQSWIERQCWTSLERQQRFQELRCLTDALRPFTAAEEQNLRDSCADADQKRRLHEVRSSREYAFCLFPADHLQAFYQKVLCS